jgi:DNA mismatch repair ATPase MutS
MDNKLQIDHHTASDLQIFEARGDKTVLDLFDETVTADGKLKLKERFYNPFNSRASILEVQVAIRYIQENLESWTFPITPHDANAINLYYISKSKPLQTEDGLLFWAEGVVRRIFSSEFREISLHGTSHFIRFLEQFQQWIDRVDKNGLPSLLKNILVSIKTILNEGVLSEVLREGATNAKHGQLLWLDKQFREVNSVKYVMMLNQVYELEALISIAIAGKKNGFCFAEMLDSDAPVVDLTDAWHPFLKAPVVNNASLGGNENVVFLTGPNMAGKTTFLRALGICVYLAHLGFPIPARQGRLSVFNGLLSSINTEDSVTQGYSYFYSEVLRVKKAAQFVKDTPKVLLIMDELFKGTNIKDAYDGSLMVIKGLAKNPNCLVVISSHLLELANDLKNVPSVSFSCFSSKVVDGKPQFDYKIKSGISSERIGLLILKNEGVDKLLGVDLE